MKPSRPLDSAVAEARQALGDQGVPDPVLLFLCGTGLPSWAVPQAPAGPAHFEHTGSLELAGVPGIPELWAAAELIFGTVTTEQGPLVIWLLADVSLDAPFGPDSHAFERGFFCWLAAQSGASVCLHTSAGGHLPNSPFESGALCLARDSINLSGSSPLIGIGDSKLGPRFPDLTQLFSPALRHLTAERGRALGIDTPEAIIADTTPVSMPTAAERRWFKTAGADAWGQGLTAPFLAAAHAGLEVLAITVLIAPSQDDAPRGSDVQDLLRASEAAAPALDDLLANLAIPMAEAAREAQEDLS